MQQRGHLGQASLAVHLCERVKAASRALSVLPATSASAMSSSIVSSLSVSPAQERGELLCPERVPHPVALEEVPDDHRRVVRQQDLS